MQIAEEKKAFTLHLPVNHLDQHLSGSLLQGKCFPLMVSPAIAC
jgi:hypothetical protein